EFLVRRELALGFVELGLKRGELRLKLADALRQRAEHVVGRPTTPTRPACIAHLFFQWAERTALARPFVAQAYKMAARRARVRQLERRDDIQASEPTTVNKPHVLILSPHVG